MKSLKWNKEYNFDHSPYGKFESCFLTPRHGKNQSSSVYHSRVLKILEEFSQGEK